MGLFGKSYAQSGLTCATAKDLGSAATFSKTESFNMPGGEIWMKYTNPAGPVRIKLEPDATGGVNSLKFKQIKIYLDACGGTELFSYNFNTTQALPFNYLLTQVPVYSNIYIYIERYINTSCGGCDVAYNDFNIALSSNNNLMGITNCNTNTCENNLVVNGNFEEHGSFFDLNDDWNQNVCGWNSVFNEPDYYNGSNLAFPDVLLPGISTGFPPPANKYYIDAPPTNNWYAGALTNQAVVGLSLDDNASDIITGNLSVNLTSGKNYYLSFDATNSGRPKYSGRLDIDISDQINYNPSASDFNFVDLQFNGNTGTFKANWQSFQTVITANGGENYIHIGNLLPTTNNTVTSQPNYVSGTLEEYVFIDNIALVPIANAGDDVSLCPGATAALGGCAIPSAIYSWSPAVGLSSASVSNPTVTGQGYSILYTVTVTVTIGGTQYIETDQVTINSGGSSIILAASPLVITNPGTSTLTVSPAGTGTYDFYDVANPGIILQNSGSNIFTTPTISANTSYGVIFTDASGCTAQTSISIVFTANPCNSSSPLTHLTTNSIAQLPLTAYTGQTFVVSNGFTFNSTEDFTACEFWIQDGATVNVNSGNTLYLNLSLVRQCDKMWNRINNQGTVKASNTIFTQGDRAIVMRNGSNNVFTDCEFNDNVYGISSLTSTTVQTVELTVTGTTFRHLNGFVPIYPMQTPRFTLPAAGIQLRDLSQQTIGSDGDNPNLFNNMYLGIINSNTDLTVNNSYFDQFVILNPQAGAIPPAPLPAPTNTSPYTLSGIAIYGAQGLNGAFMTTVNGAPGQDFANNATIRGAQFKGIVTDGMAADILNVNITNCSVGVNFTNLLPNFNSRVLGCSLNVSYTGMFFFGSRTLSTTLAQENYVEINPIPGATGLSCVRMDNPTGTNNQAAIRVISNNLRSNGSNNAVYIRNCGGGGSYVSCNTITKLFDGAFRGILVENSGGSIVKTNTISATNPYTNLQINRTTSNVGIAVNLSPAISISCNIINNFYVGMLFGGNNAASGQFLSGNSMGTHYWGLYYAATATVGPCLNRGNRWTQAAPVGGFHARNDNFAQINPTCVANSQPQYQLNRIVTGTAIAPNGFNNTTSIPNGSPNVTNPCGGGIIGLNNTGWITNQANTPDYDGCGIEQDSCNIWTSMRGEQSKEEMEMMAQSENLASDFNNETTYMVKESLYEYLNKYPEGKEDSEVLESLYNELENTPVGKNNHIKNLIAQTSPANLMLQLKDNIGNLKAAAEILTYTIKNNGNVANAQQNYEQYLNENNNLNNQLNALKMNKRILANMNNNIIQPDNIVSSNTKVITDIYLNFILGVENVDLSSKLSIIASVANQCPFVGGPAVYWARGIYELAVPGVVYNDDDVCETISNERRGLVNQNNQIFTYNTITSDKVLTYPNPSNGMFTVEIDKAFVNANLQIFDVLGSLVFEQKIISQKSNFDLSYLNKGSYIMAIKNTDGQIYRNKININ